MKYGYFDTDKREYVIDRIDTPCSFTNYLGVDDMVAVVNQTAGGYVYYKSPEYHRITRFRGNGVPEDRPGQYIYLRDDESGKYWSVSWQPTGRKLAGVDGVSLAGTEDAAGYRYRARHGLSYSVYECAAEGIEASQTMFIPRKDAVELWDVRIRNTTDRPRTISVFSYLEFSFHLISIDNQNYQMSLYCAGADYQDGIIEEDLHYEENGYQFFTASFQPDGFDCARDRFLGRYRTESDPEAVERGECFSSAQKGGNPCAALMKKLTLTPGQEVRLIYTLGEGDRSEGRKMRAKYSDPAVVDDAFRELRRYWDEKCSAVRISTPDKGMNELINAWNLYQSQINVLFSRFASFIEVGGRVGLGYRDTAQDAMTILPSSAEECRWRMSQLLCGLTSYGYGLHLFEPEWFEPQETQSFNSPTIRGASSVSDKVHGLENACSDDALWLVSSVVEYIRETGDYAFADELYPYADTYLKVHAEAEIQKKGAPDPENEAAGAASRGGYPASGAAGSRRSPEDSANAVNSAQATGSARAAQSACRYHEDGSDGILESVYDHLKRILDFSYSHRGQDGICQGLRADWNDCLNLGGGESALVSFLEYWALENFISLAEKLGREDDVLKYTKQKDEVAKACESVLWDDNGGWYIRGITKHGKKIGTSLDTEGRVHLESNSWAILSGEAPKERAEKALEAIDRYLFTPYGIRLNAPSYTVPDDDIGFVTRVYPGLKENGSIFSHPNPWAEAAACVVGRGDLAMKFYRALCPYYQNDRMEIRKAEPYSYCQFIAGPDHTAYGQARHPFMTGSGGWSYYAATEYILGIRPDFDELKIDPCIPADWKEFTVTRRWRGAEFEIHVTNPDGVMKGVHAMTVDGQPAEHICQMPAGTSHRVEVVMGE